MEVWLRSGREGRPAARSWTAVGRGEVIDAKSVQVYRLLPNTGTSVWRNSTDGLFGLFRGYLGRWKLRRARES